jgi:hypothetical protein
MAGYKGIQFAKDYNKSFANFKKEFEGVHVFKNIHPNEREKAFKEAYKIANPNGKFSEPRKKSADNKTKASSKSSV